MEGIIEKVTDKFGGAFKIGNDWYNFTVKTRDIASKLESGTKIEFDFWENDKGKKYLKCVKGIEKSLTINHTDGTSQPIQIVPPAQDFDNLNTRVIMICEAINITNQKLDKLTEMVRGLLMSSGKEVVG